MSKEFDPYLRFGPLRWPPGASTSLQAGVLGVAAVRMGLHDDSQAGAIAYIADGYVEFWTTLLGDVGLTIGGIVLGLTVLWILFANWRLVFRGAV